MAKRSPEVYPLRKGYVGAAPLEVITAVRMAVPDWDGENMTTVRRCIAKVSKYEQDFDTWTYDDILQEFALSWARMVKEFDGHPTTSDYRITPIQWTTVTIPLNLPTGEPVLQATEPEARAFMDGKRWCTAAYARQRYGIRPQQLTRASTQEKGLRGVVVTRKMAQVENGKRGRRWVHHAGDLQRLANALERGE
jgi:hypothetical protein